MARGMNRRVFESVMFAMLFKVLAVRGDGVVVGVGEVRVDSEGVEIAVRGGGEVGEGNFFEDGGTDLFALHGRIALGRNR